MFWWLCVIVAPAVACAVAYAGYGMALGSGVAELGLVAAGSIAEEIVFRGALQPAIAAWLARRSARSGGFALVTPANAVTSLAFSAFHLWGHPLAVAIGVFPISLALGRARELSGRTWPAAALHVYFNALLYLATAWLACGR